jgi:gliding motility-associated-like protein
MISSPNKILTLFLVMCGAVHGLHAQSFYNQGSTVSVLDGTIFSVKDSLVNTGTFVNNGNLLIGGTWLNTGTYDPGAGEITFNSTSATLPQIINHSNQSFSKLTISGGGKKLILADITIEDEIILSDGVIEAENGARVIINQTASVSGGSDLSHINAPVYHRGQGEKLYPLGTGSLYLPVSLMDIADQASFIGVETISLQGGSLPKAPSLDAISVYRYWHIDVLQGSLNSRVSLPVKSESFNGSLENLVVAESPSVSENFETIGRSSANGTINDGVIVSGRNVTWPFVTLASSSTDDGSLLVYNAVSPNNDGLNDYLRILNIENYPKNKFTVFNRWGDKVFEIDDYDNIENIFKGRSNINGEKDLVNGTYFYVLQTEKDAQKVNGFLVLKN